LFFVNYFIWIINWSFWLCSCSSWISCSFFCWIST
jgi:hypothetical protein